MQVSSDLRVDPNSGLHASQESPLIAPCTDGNSNQSLPGEFRDMSSPNNASSILFSEQDAKTFILNIAGFDIDKGINLIDLNERFDAMLEEQKLALKFYDVIDSLRNGKPIDHGEDEFKKPSDLANRINARGPAFTHVLVEKVKPTIKIDNLDKMTNEIWLAQVIEKAYKSINHEDKPVIVCATNGDTFKETLLIPKQYSQPKPQTNEGMDEEKSVSSS